MSMKSEDIRSMIDWIGEEGTRAGIESSHLTVSELKKLADTLSAQVSAKASRKEIIAAIVGKANKRIDKTLEDLLAMEASDLLEYFDKVRPSKAELLSVLGELDFHPGTEAQRSLYKYAARQISETGMFQRVATNNATLKN